MAWHHIKLRSRRWPCIKICQAICIYQAANHSQPPKYLAQYSTTTIGCKWLGTTSNLEAADGLASRYAKPSAPTRPPNIHNLQTTWICLSKLYTFFLKQIGKNASNTPTTDICLKQYILFQQNKHISIPCHLKSIIFNKNSQSPKYEYLSWFQRPACTNYQPRASFH